jgi:hypothetical protein
LTEWWVVEKKKATATNFEELLPWQKQRESSGKTANLQNMNHEWCNGDVLWKNNIKIGLN